MTVGELKEALKDVDDTFPVRYNYDMGFSFPEIKHVYIAEGGPKWAPVKGCVILDENEPEEAR